MQVKTLGCAVLFLGMCWSVERAVAQCQTSTGPDVIVGDLMDMSNYGKVSGINAYDIGTSSCNIGTANLLWISSTNQHPVIAQNVYRLKTVQGAAQFEQVGMSWLKHGFTALTQNLCCTCSGQGGAVLGVGCSDPYCCGLNGDQQRLGPRSEVNVATGVYTYPYILNWQQTGNAIFKRLQIKDADLEPTMNTGAVYIGETQYVASDDAAAGNKNNNASYRRINVTKSGTFPNATYTLALSQTTQRQKPAILAWRDADATVNITNIDVPGDGRMIIAWKVTNTAPGVYHYEYAIENLTSDRCAQAFVVPVLGAVISNVGFHDVDYHSGEPYSLTDWAATQAGGNITWATQTFATNANANALRWSTMYNFRFDATTGPQPNLVNATIRLFKPGTPTEVTVPIQVPLPADCNNNGVLDNDDIASGASADCNENIIPDECELAVNDCNHNGVPDDCDLAGQDCDNNRVLDSCEIASRDCNANGVVDGCEMYGNDCDGNGVFDGCQLADNDCDGNRVPDHCQSDCDRDGLIDACEILAGAPDCNDDGIPDLCEVTPPPPPMVSPGLPIPDNNANGVISIINYVGGGIVTDVNVKVSIPHTAVSQLRVTLSKDAVSRVMWFNRCGSFDNLNVTFDDSGSFISCSNLAGTYTPTSCGGSSLSGFNGLNANGNWTLTVSDNTTGETGTFASWTLNVTSTIPPVPALADANANLVPDTCECGAPGLPDANANGVADSCECLNCKGDGNRDGKINGRDIRIMCDCLTGGPAVSCVDMDGNGAINAADLSAFVAKLISPNPPCTP